MLIKREGGEDDGLGNYGGDAREGEGRKQKKRKRFHFPQLPANIVQIPLNEPQFGHRSIAEEKEREKINERTHLCVLDC